MASSQNVSHRGIREQTHDEEPVKATGNLAGLFSEAKAEPSYNADEKSEAQKVQHESESMPVKQAADKAPVSPAASPSWQRSGVRAAANRRASSASVSPVRSVSSPPSDHRGKVKESITRRTNHGRRDRC